MNQFSPSCKQVIITILVLIIFGCSKKIIDSTVEVTPKTLPSQVKPEVIVLSQQAIKIELQSISSTSMIFVTGSSTAQLIKVGSVLVADTSSRFPYGLLRKVTDRREQNEQTIFTVAGASLNDVFNEAEISIQQDLTNVSLKGGREPSDKVIDIPVKYKFKNAAGEVTDNTLEGGIKLTSQIDFLWKKQANLTQPDEVRIGWTGQINARLNVHIAANASTEAMASSVKNFPKEAKQIAVKLPGYLFVRTIYGVPIVINFRAPVYTGLIVKAAADAIVGAQVNKTFNTVSYYKNGEWSIINNSSDAELTYTTPPKFKTKLKFSVSVVNPQIEAHPYDLDEAMIYSGINIGFDGTLECNSKPNFEASGFVVGEVGGSVRFDILKGSVSADKKFYRKDLVDLEKLKNLVEHIPGCEEELEDDMLSGRLYITPYCNEYIANGPGRAGVNMRVTLKSDMTKYNFVDVVRPSYKNSHIHELRCGFVLPGGQSINTGVNNFADFSNDYGEVNRQKLAQLGKTDWQNWKLCGLSDTDTRLDKVPTQEELNNTMNPFMGNFTKGPELKLPNGNYKFFIYHIKTTATPDKNSSNGFSYTSKLTYKFIDIPSPLNFIWQTCPPYTPGDLVQYPNIVVDF